METKIVFISCLKIFMKKLLGKNINHTNSNKKEEKNRTLWLPGHRIMFLLSYNSMARTGATLFVFTRRRKMEKIKYRPSHVACEADAAVRNRVVHRLVCRSTAVGVEKNLRSRKGNIIGC